MKKIALSGIAAVFLFMSNSCLKGTDCKNKTVQSEDAAMQAYATANGLTVTQHPSGMYYQITNQGSGGYPPSTSSVSVRYTGKLLDGTIFDQASTATSFYPLSGFIAGWQIGIPLIQKGGSIKLIVPSAYAYGCKAVGNIPANSILYFDIDLIDFHQ